MLCKICDREAGRLNSLFDNIPCESTCHFLQFASCYPRAAKFGPDTRIVCPSPLSGKASPHFPLFLPVNCGVVSREEPPQLAGAQTLIKLHSKSKLHLCKKSWFHLTIKMTSDFFCIWQRCFWFKSTENKSLINEILVIYCIHISKLINK